MTDRSVTEERYPPTHETASFNDAVATVWRWKRFILINMIVLTTIIVGVTFLLPKWYRSTASILPPRQQGLLSFGGGGASLLKGLGSLSKLGGSDQNGSYNYFAILKSRSTNEEMVRRFDLMRVYEIKDTIMEDALKELHANSSFEMQDDDNINIEVFDKDPNRAAAMANTYVEILNRKSIEMSTREATNNRVFLEQRLNEAKDSLRLSEDALRTYQEGSGMVLTPEQAAGASAIAEMFAMKAQKEIRVSILRQTVSPSNAALAQEEMELGEISRRLDSIPRTGLQVLRLYRRVITSQKILEFLAPLHEQAKIEERKDVPILVVLDQAVPAERKTRPQRGLIILSGVALSLFVMLIAGFLLEGLKRRKGSSNTSYEKMYRTVQRIVQLYRIPE